MDNNFEPKIISDYFTEITTMQHGSGKEDPIRNWVKGKADGLKKKYSDNRSNIDIVFYDEKATDPTQEQEETSYPGQRVILLRRKGANEYLDKKPVILQAHLDMVTVPSNNIFPLKLQKDEKDGYTWLDTNGGTTLGADDGIGVSVILSLLEEEKLMDVPLECLFTVQEETNMGGAKNFDISLLTGSKYINVDAEDLKVIIYGSAGGSTTSYKGKVEYNTDLSGYKTYFMSVYNLKSGHSGIDIGKGRQNAIKIITDILVRLNKRLNKISEEGSINSYDILLNSIKRSGEVRSNSIPAAAEAIVSVPSVDAASFLKDVKELFNSIYNENKPVEKDLYIGVVEYDKKWSDKESKAMTDATSDSVLMLLNLLPHGVIKMIPSNPSLVETSTNLYDVEISEDGIISINSSNRSSNKNSLERLNNIQSNIANCFGFTAEVNINSYPAWQPDESSELLKIAKKTYEDLYGDEAETTVVHAGLECGWIAERSNGRIDCISIGPTIQNPHTCNERLQLKDKNNNNTIQSFYDTIIDIILNVIKSE